MAVSADRVVVELEAKLDRYTSRVTGAERHFDRSMRNIQGSAQRTEARVASAFRNIAGAAGITIGTAGVVLAARQFLRYADSAKNLEAQLRLATRESGNFARAQEDVRRISRETRSGLEETATLYATFQRNARELGITQQQAARATETVTKAFQISGATAAEAAGGLRQFLQGIQSGTLRGEELNSVLENAPRLARLIADSLGVTIGQLRALGQAGNLAGDQLIDALTNRRFTEQIDAEFRELPITFDQAMTLVNNAAIETFGAFDRGGRFSEAIANFILQGTDGMEDIAAAAEQAGIDIRAAFEGLSDVFVPLWEGAIEAFGGINAEVTNTRRQIAGLLSLFDFVTTGLDRAASGARGGFVRGARNIPFVGPFVGPLADRLAPPATPVGGRARESFLEGYDRSARQGQADAQARAMGLRTRNGRNFSGQEFQRYLNEPERYDIFGNPRDRNAARPPSGGGGSSRARRRGGGRGESAETRARREAAETQRFENELAELNQDLIAARQATVAAAEAVAAFEIQEIEVARDRQNAAYQASVAQTRGDRAVAQSRADQLVALNNQVAEERIRAVRLREERRLFDEREEALERQLELDRTDLEIMAEMERLNGQLADTREAQRDSALRELDLSTEMERIQLRSVIEAADRLAALEALGQATRAEVAAAQDAAQIAGRRLEALNGQEAAQRQLINRQYESPRERYLRDLSRVGNEMNDAMDQVAIDGFERLNDELADTITGFLNLGGVAGRVLNQIIGDLLRIAIQQQLIRPLANALFGGGGGGGGGSVADIAMLGAKLFMAGGGKPGFATGGSIYVGGRPGVDRNLLSLNGSPVARVSQGERIDVVPQGRAVSPVGGAMVRSSQAAPVARVQLELSGDIDARIVKVSGPVAVEVFRAGAPQIVAGAKAETIREVMRPRLNRG